MVIPAVKEAPMEVQAEEEPGVEVPVVEEHVSDVEE